MDLTRRKNKFIEQFLKIVSPEKLERFEALLQTETSTDNNIVAYTIKGEPLTKKQYINNNNQALESFKKGAFKTQNEMIKKYSAK